MSLKQDVLDTLEAITDPCSIAAGAPAGLVSMGLVGEVTINESRGGARVDVTLFVTEPGCMMSAIFQVAAKNKIEELPGVETANVDIDYDYLWSPSQMTPEYRKKLEEYRKCQQVHMKSIA